MPDWVVTHEAVAEPDLRAAGRDPRRRAPDLPGRAGDVVAEIRSSSPRPSDLGRAGT